jgi:hypothetical protein
VRSLQCSCALCAVFGLPSTDGHERGWAFRVERDVSESNDLLRRRRQNGWSFHGHPPGGIIRWVPRRCVGGHPQESPESGSFPCNKRAIPTLNIPQALQICKDSLYIWETAISGSGSQQQNISCNCITNRLM